ncbi:MAG: hydrogenase 4 subunit B [Rhizobiales bacterium]|nr:hydrogenase 4 subunit B [Hyphomicrobiales bacterium]
MTSLAIALASIAGLFATSILAVALSKLPSRNRVVYSAAALACIALLAVGLLRLGAANGEADAVMTLPIGLPWLGIHLRMDALSAFFLAVINLGGFGASIYGIGYGEHEESPGRVLPFFPAFLAGMNLVLLADDAFSFLVSWEFMSLASWAMVMAHHQEAETRRAGYVYLLMAGFGSLALLLTFGLLAGPTGHYAFITMRAGEHDTISAGLILILALIGAGSKAGLVPLHAWLPLAHPAAPSHVSALMSGVMTKVAVYGFIRIVFDLLGTPPWWASLLVLIVGSVTAVLGVLQALMERDLKRLLAYSTIENIGVIFIGLGLALAFQENAMPAAAALALTAALFHALNHSLFKSLLFFGSGAVLTATHERDLDRLGGLIHRMPVTAFLFLAGSMAISALPPLNGFVSEWLTFQAVLLSPNIPQWSLKVLVPAVGGVLALAAALAAACFVRAYGIVFLGRPRSAAAAKAVEVDRYSLAAMVMPALLCLLAGLFPGPIIDAIGPTVRSIIGAQMPVQSALPWYTIIPIAESRSSYNGLLVFLFITISTLIAVEVLHRFASRAVRRAPAWDCGYPDPSPLTQYSAASASQPIRRVFAGSLLHARETVEMPPPGSSEPARFRLALKDVIWETIYAPIPRVIAASALRLDRFQFLTIRQYLSLVFAALVILLLGLAIWP